MYLKIESHQLKTTLKAIEKVEFLIHLRNHCQDIFNFLKKLHNYRSRAVRKNLI